MRGDIFEIGRGRTGGLKVHARRRGDAALPPVWYDLDACHFGDVGDAADLGQAPRARNVGLHHRDLPAFDPVADLVAAGSRLGAADPYRTPRGEPGMAVEIVMLKRRLGKENVAVG